MPSSPFKLLPLLALLLGSCQTSSWIFPAERTGPPFAEAFVDPGVLLEPSGLEATRKRLSRTPLPYDEAHHEQLLQLVQQAEEIEVENLVLLAEAVALPSRRAGQSERSQGTHISVKVGEKWSSSFLREEGPYSHYVDEILLLGAPKLKNPSANKLGRLMAATQTRAAVVSLYEILGEQVDDRSTEAFKNILDGASFDPVRNDLLIGVYVARGELDQEKAELGLEALSFDDSRLAFIQAWVPTMTAFPSDRIAHLVGAFSFDDGRAEVARAFANAPIGEISGETMRDLLDQFSFDDGRTEAMRALAPRVQIEDPRLLSKLIDEASFDDGRLEILRSAMPCLVSAEAFGASMAQDCLDEFSFDGGRESAMEVLAPVIQIADLREVESLLETASFDDGRVNMVRSLAPRLRSLHGSPRELEDLLEVFSFDSGRTDALRSLAPVFRGLPASDLQRALEEGYSFDSGRKEGAKVLGLR